MNQDLLQSDPKMDYSQVQTYPSFKDELKVEEDLNSTNLQSEQASLVKPQDHPTFMRKFTAVKDSIASSQGLVKNFAYALGGIGSLCFVSSAVSLFGMNKLQGKKVQADANNFIIGSAVLSCLMCVGVIAKSYNGYKMQQSTNVQTAQSHIKKGYILLGAVAICGLLKINQDFQFAGLAQTQRSNKLQDSNLELYPSKGRKLFSLEKKLKNNKNKLEKINWKKYLDVDNWDTEEIKNKINKKIDDIADKIDKEVDNISNYIDKHQDEIADAEVQAEKIYKKSMDIADEVVDKTTDSVEDAINDIYDIFSDEYQKIKEKINDHKRNQTLQATEEDEDYSEGEDDEGHEDEEKYVNKTEYSDEDWDEELAHMEEDAKNVKTFESKKSSNMRDQSTDTDDEEGDDEYPWDQEDGDDWESMRPSGPRYGGKHFGGKRGNHERRGGKHHRRGDKDRRGRRFEHDEEFSLQAPQNMAKDGSVYWKWQQEQEQKNKKHDASTNTQPADAPKKLMQTNQRKPKVQQIDPNTVRIVSITSVIVCVGLLASMQFVALDYSKKLTKFNYLKSVHENENAVCVTPDQAKVIIEKMSTPHQSLQASQIIDAHTSTKQVAEAVLSTYNPPKLQASAEPQVMYSQAPQPTQYQMYDSQAIQALINQKKSGYALSQPEPQLVQQQPITVAPAMSLTTEQIAQLIQQNQQLRAQVSANQTITNPNLLI
eukprot:403354458